MAEVAKNGVDTIKIYTSDFLVKGSESDLKDNHIYKSMRETEKGILTKYQKIKTECITNCRLYDLQILPNINQLKIECSIPKYLYQDNFELADKTQLFDFMQSMQNELKNNNIITDIENMKIGRLDLTNYAEMNYITTEYFSRLLHKMNCKYIKNDKLRNYTHSMTWQNKSKGYCLYDKMAEIKKSDVFDSKILRCEKRVLNNNTIKNKYHISTIKELYNNFEEIGLSANNLIKSDIFNYADNKALSDNVLLGIDRIIEISKEYNKNNRFFISGTIRDFMNNYAIETLKNQYAINDIFERLCANLINDNMNSEKKAKMRYKIKKEIERIETKQLYFFERLEKKENIKIYDLYEEILHKLIA